MNILFVSGNPHLPQVFGGVEINTHELATELVGRGHHVAVAAKLSLRDRFGLSRAALTILGARGVTYDSDLGYGVFRGRKLLGFLPDLPRPDIAIIQTGAMPEFGRRLAGLGVPSVAYLHGLGFEDWQELRSRPHGCLPFCGYLAVSQFAARRFKQLCGIDPIVLAPFFRRERYETPLQGGMVTFINPVPPKGVELAIQIAQLCPAIRFSFVYGWRLGFSDWANLQCRLRSLSNVVLRRRTSDMRSIYRDTKILLVPSQWEETWGRVASEAQCSGIPVVASNRGGLPEAVGPGGILLDPGHSPATWAAVIRQLYSDRNQYEALSQAARQHAARPSLNPDLQIASLMALLAGFIENAGHQNCSEMREARASGLGGALPKSRSDRAASAVMATTGMKNPSGAAATTMIAAASPASWPVDRSC